MFSYLKTAPLFAILLLAKTASAQTWRPIVSEDFGSTTFAAPSGISASSTPANNLLPGTTSYNPFIPPSNNPGAGATTDGDYLVGTWSGRSDYPVWIRAWDRTSNDGTGYMMQINANPNKRGEADGSYYLYSTSAFDIPGANYRVSFYAANILSSGLTGQLEAHIGVSIRNTPNATGTLYGGGNASSEWILPRTTVATNDVLPWEQKSITFSLPANYPAGTPLYFNFYNTDPIGGNTQGNDLVLDDILIEMQVVSIAGRVYVHKLGSATNYEPGVDYLVNNTTTPMFMYVLKSDGTILAKAPVQADGTFLFSGCNGVPYTTSDVGMKLELSGLDLAVGATLGVNPNTLTNFVMDSYGSGGNGELSSPTAAWLGATSSLTAPSYMNFAHSDGNVTNYFAALRPRPETYNVTNNITGAPVVGQSVSLASGPMQGSTPLYDPSQQSWSGKPLVITSLPTNGFDLYYDGVKITAADIAATNYYFPNKSIDANGFKIDNYDPAKLTLQPTASTPPGTTTTSFNYTALSRASDADLTPATYDVNFSQPLPVVFGDINATLNNNNLSVLWTALKEQNNAYFDVQTSTDGENFTSLGKVATIATDGNSDTPNNYRFSATINTQSLVAGVSLLALLLALPTAGKRSRKILGAAILVIALSLANMACNKKNDATVDVSGKNLFIRIVQVDKDGTKNYSKIIKVKKQ